MRPERTRMAVPAAIREMSPAPMVVVSARGVNRLRSGHVWVYRSDIVSAEGVSPGAIVAVSDERRRFVGSALYSSSSQIALRMISIGPVINFPALVHERIRDALAYREKLVCDTDA